MLERILGGGARVDVPRRAGVVPIGPPFTLHADSPADRAVTEGGLRVRFVSVGRGVVGGRPHEGVPQKDAESREGLPTVLEIGTVGVGS